MNEFTIGSIASASLVGLALSCFFYMWGGRSGKWRRRYISSFILALTVWLSSLALGNFDFRLLGIYPILIVAFSMGYSGNNLSTFGKVIKRSIYALGVVGAGGLCAYVFGGNAVWVLPVHLLVGAGSIYLGVKNPIQAASEEVFCAASLNLGLLMYAFSA